MKKYFFIAVVAFAAVTVTVFIGNSADNALDQTRAINDKKEACLKNEGNKVLDDDCRVIIREARGE
jgi:hypothetical protein